MLNKNEYSSDLSPQEIVNELDKFIIGQNEAKKAVAIALRNRWRRMQLPADMRNEIAPKNILMIGPTGVGKTEIARRLAKLVGAPFIKVEATKFTEVGYVGRDVESIIRDLANIAVGLLQDKAREEVKDLVDEKVEERLLDALLPPIPDEDASTNAESSARNAFRSKLRAGKLEEREIEIQVSGSSMGVQIMGPPGMEDATNHLQQMFKKLSGNNSPSRKMPISKARRLLSEEISENYINEEEINANAIEIVEQSGIVFIDEMDKITQSNEPGQRTGNVSREGVQRDLLPIVEGCSVKTRCGMIKTDHILFITSGAFHLSKPSDLIPELQGRLPIRVNLQSLRASDFERILKEPDYSLIEQYKGLLATEGLKVKFSAKAIKQIAEIAWQVNENTENIGARRLQTTMEKLLEKISFDAQNIAQERKGKALEIDDKYVKQQLEALVEDKDLSRYIL